MADLSKKKSDFASLVVKAASSAQAVARDFAELNSYFTANAFQTGGANAIVDADLTGTEIGHLTAALLNDAVTAIATMNLNAGQRDTLRKVAKQLIPTASF